MEEHSIKAYVATGASSPRFALQEAPAPQAAPGTLVLGVEAISLNPGEITWPWDAGVVPGWDIAGTVLQASPDGAGPAVGTRLAAILEAGGWAEQVAVPLGQLAVLPDGVSTEEAVTLGVAGVTARRILQQSGPLDGKQVLVTGAAGGVGRFAVQLAHRASATVTALVNREGQADELRGLGAAHVVVGTDALPGRYDVVVDGVGGPALEAAIAAAAPGARIVTYGLASGRPAQIPFFAFVNAPGSTLQGYFIWQDDRDSLGADLGHLAALVAAGQLDARVAHVRPWADLDAAADDLVSGRARGKTVVRLP